MNTAALSPALTRMLALGALCFLCVGCITPPPPPPADQHLLDFLQDGTTPKETAVLRLGQPSAQFESGRILTYRLGFEKDHGYFLRDAGVTNWLSLRFSLVLVFNDQGVLQNHSLVEVR